VSEENRRDLLEEAKFYFLNQQYDQAESILKSILKDEPTNIEALFHLGLLYEVTNQLEEAKKYFERVLEIDSKHQDARTHLEKVTELY
jgi:tetratricopeptide (TPR) repeat protein